VSLIVGLSVRAADRPNVLLLVGEDLGTQLGSYGDPYARTPVLDGLASRGARFTNAWTTHSACSPARASLLTGLYPFQNGQIGLATHRYAMFRTWENLPSALRAHGYRTGIIGKLHVNPASAFPFDFRWNDPKKISFGRRDVDEIAKVAGEFFEKDRERPFFLSINFPDAHLPFLRQVAGLPTDPLGADDVESLPFVGVGCERLREGTANYYNSVERLDAGVGRVLAALEQSGRASDTLIVFLGDHGPQFSRGKGTCFEGGLKIPLIVSWAGQVRPGEVSSELVSIVDIFPTVLQAVSLPARESLPGRSLLPLAAGRRPTSWRRFVFAERTAYSAASFFPQRALRDERYKLVVNLLAGRPNPVAVAYRTHANRFFRYGTTMLEAQGEAASVGEVYQRWEEPPAVELYDLENDPWEFRNLVDRPALREVRDRLLAELERFRREHADPLLDHTTLQKLEAEHAQVAKEKPRGRYGRGESWNYLDYLDPPEKSSR